MASKRTTCRSTAVSSRASGWPRNGSTSSCACNALDYLPFPALGEGTGVREHDRRWGVSHGKDAYRMSGLRGGLRLFHERLGAAGGRLFVVTGDGHRRAPAGEVGAGANRLPAFCVAERSAGGLGTLLRRDAGERARCRTAAWSGRALPGRDPPDGDHGGRPLVPGYGGGWGGRGKRARRGSLCDIRLLHGELPRLPELPG